MFINGIMDIFRCATRYQKNNNQNQEVSECVVEGVENLTNINETFVEGIMVDEIHEDNPVIVSAYII